MRIPRLLLALLLLGTALGGLLAAAPGSRAAETACFAETGQCVSDPFLTYWREHGGLAINGYPLSDQHPEVLEDGKIYQVQYFERARFELHPENAGTPYEVLLGLLGREQLLARYPGGPPRPVR